MESLSNNQSYSGDNSTLFNQSLPVTGLVAYYFASLIIMIPVIFFNVLVLLALLVDRNTVGIIRLVLCNIPAACIVLAITTLVYDVAGVALVLADTRIPESVIQLCKGSLFFVSVCGKARFLFLAAFSVTVYHIVRFRASKKKSNRLTFVVCAITVIVLWAVAILGSLPVLFDTVVSNSCRYTAIGGTINAAVFIVIFGIGGCTTSIAFLLHTAFYIQKHTISDANDNPFKKALLKLGFFLLIGNFINIIGQIVPAIVNVAVSEEQYTLAVSLSARYISLILLDLSLIPTPILLIIYFKPIRMHLKKWLCCCWGRKAQMLACRKEW